MGKEAALQAKCTEYLREKGVYHKKIILANSAGTPDILACINGKFIAFELKAPDGKPTALQLHNQRKIKESGGECFIIYSFHQFRDIVNEYNT